MVKKQLKIPLRMGDHVNGLRMFMMRNVIIMSLMNALKSTDSSVMLFCCNDIKTGK